MKLSDAFDDVPLQSDINASSDINTNASGGMGPSTGEII